MRMSVVLLVSILLLLTNCSRRVEYTPKPTPRPTLSYFKVDKMIFKPLEVEYEIKNSGD